MFFIGGVTYLELAAMRFMTDKSTSGDVAVWGRGLKSRARSRLSIPAIIPRAV